MGKLGRRALAAFASLHCRWPWSPPAGADDDSSDSGSSGWAGEERAGRSRSRRLRSRTSWTRRWPTRSNGIEPHLARLHAADDLSAHAEGKEGAELIPGAGRGHAEASDGRQDLQADARKGIKYSDGTPVKASDFEHAIKRVLEPGVGRLGFFEVIQGVDKYIEGQEGRRGHLGHHVRRRDR